jgi:hypothetical protein
MSGAPGHNAEHNPIDVSPEALAALPTLEELELSYLEISANRFD